MKKLILIYLHLFIGSVAAGQGEKMVLPSDLKQQTIVTEPVTLRKGYFRASTELTYIVLNKGFNESGKKEYYYRSSWSTSYIYKFGLSYGITDRIQIGLTIPFENYRMEVYFLNKTPLLNLDYSYSMFGKGRGLSDCSLAFLYQIIPEIEKRISLTIENNVTFPTGKKNFTDYNNKTNSYGLPIGGNYNLPTGIGCVYISTNLIARKIHYPYSYGATASYNYNFRGSKIIRPDNTSEKRFKYGNNIVVSCYYNLHLNDWIVFGNQFNYFHTGKGKLEYEEPVTTDPMWDISYSPTLVFQIRRFRISEIVLIPLFGKNTEADPAYSLSVGYVF